MAAENVTAKYLKREVFKLLRQNDAEKSLETVLTYPARRIVNPLFSFFYNTDELIKWRAVTAMGRVVSELARHDMESARVVMRRLMWNLNDESGGIGWGSAEAMGEIMACHSELAEEYSCILISYTMEDGNFIELEALQRGVIWACGRLAHVRPRLLIQSTPHLIPFMTASDATIRGLAAWTAGALNPDLTKPLLGRLTDDPAKLSFYKDWQIIECSVGRLARDAMALLDKQSRCALQLHKKHDKV